MGADPWSPKLQVLQDTINVWKLVVKKKRGQKVSSQLLRSPAIDKKAKLLNPYSLSINQAVIAGKGAISSYHSSKLKAAQWRKKHNCTLKSALAKEKGTTEQHKWQNLNRIETQ
jgi:hypothetical protein